MYVGTFIRVYKLLVVYQGFIFSTGKTGIIRSQSDVSFLLAPSHPHVLRFSQSHDHVRTAVPGESCDRRDVGALSCVCASRVHLGALFHGWFSYVDIFICLCRRRNICVERAIKCVCEFWGWFVSVNLDVIYSLLIISVWRCLMICEWRMIF